MNSNSIPSATMAGLLHQSRTYQSSAHALDRELLTKNGRKNVAPAPATLQGPPKGEQSAKALCVNNEKRKQESLVIPVETRVIQTVKKPRTCVNHSYRDFSWVPRVVDEEIPSDIEKMSFPQKVHHILSQPEYTRCISWQPHGRAFRINIPKMFENKVCPTYFGHTRYSSFLRQLSNHSFKNITQGTDRNCYYHECMLRGLPHLTKYMPRPKDARRLIADPVNEPDFYAISAKYPVPDSNESCSRASAIKPEAGTPRSNLMRALGGATVPPAKRARVMTTAPIPASAPISSVVAQLAAGRGAGEILLARSQTPRRETGNSGIDAASLLTAAYSLLPVSQGTGSPAPFPGMARSPMRSPTMSPNVDRQQLGWNTSASTSRAPLMQAAVDRNEAVLSALVAMTTQAASQGTRPLSPSPRPAPSLESSDQVLSSTLALLLQKMNDTQQQQQQQRKQGVDLISLLNGRL